MLHGEEGLFISENPAKREARLLARRQFIEYLKELGPGPECVYLPWSRVRNTYAFVKIDGVAHKATRWVYEQVVGPLPPRSGRGASGVLVCHVVCDNPPCVRPSHLLAADNRFNQHDMVAKGRGRAGARNGRAKVNEDDVRRMLKLTGQGVQQRRVAKAFGLSQTQVSRIVRGTTWPSVSRSTEGEE